MSEDSTFVRGKQPCDDCGSSDALAIYTTGTYCFSCETRHSHDNEEEYILKNNNSNTSEDLYRVSYEPLTYRNINLETARKWSYGLTQIKGKSIQCAQYLDDDRKVVAQKLRFPDKSFPWRNRQAFSGLYGQWLWRSGGRRVVITEGELDALSVSQALGNKWPVVSLPDGGGKNAVKAIKSSMEWLMTYEEIVLFFDNDEKGRETLELVRELLPPNKVKYTFTPEGFKDASDLLRAGKASSILPLIFEAKQWSPEGIVSGQALIDRLRDRPTVTSYAYPPQMPQLNFKVGGGIRLGELDTWTSGTGMGKTTVIKMLQHHFFHTTEYNQALIHLEEPVEDTGDDLVAYELGKRFSIDANAGDFRNDPMYRQAEENLYLAEDASGNHRIQVYDAFGSLELSKLSSTIRYLVQAGNCKIIWIDHLSILVSDSDEDTNERKLIDRIMHQLKNLTVELNIYIGLVSHLRKPVGNGKSFEQGAIPSLDDLRGSGGIKQLSNTVLALSRDQQAETEAERNTVKVTVLKCRKTGRTGAADYLLFSDETGRLEATQDPDELSAFDIEGEAAAY